MLSSQIWLVPVALTLAVFDYSATEAIAQTTYPFRGNYDTVINILPLTENVSQSIELATIIDPEAPYGLTRYEGLVYGQTNPVTNEVTFNIDPATFGLPDLPPGHIIFEGEGTDNKLRGTATASAVFDLENLTGIGSGTLNITGGEGLFTNAIGTLKFFETDTIIPSPNGISLNGKALITGSIEVVPEPGGGIGTLAAIGALGVGFLLRRRGCKKVDIQEQK